MADLTITATLVVPGAGAQNATGKQPVAGEAITAGQPYYIKASDGRAWKCKANTATANVPEASWTGIAMNSAAIGQPVTGQVSGVIVLGGATTVKGTTYTISAAAFGGIAAQADLVAAQTPAHNLSVIGFALDTAGTILLHNFSTGIAL